MSKSGSSRIKDIASRRVLDDASRQRRARKALESLEQVHTARCTLHAARCTLHAARCTLQDNNCDDPHADLVMSKKALSLFQDEEEQAQRRTKRKVTFLTPVTCHLLSPVTCHLSLATRNLLPSTCYL